MAVAVLVCLYLRPIACPKNTPRPLLRARERYYAIIVIPSCRYFIHVLPLYDHYHYTLHFSPPGLPSPFLLPSPLSSLTLPPLSLVSGVRHKALANKPNAASLVRLTLINTNYVDTDRLIEQWESRIFWPAGRSKEN